MLEVPDGIGSGALPVLLVRSIGFNLLRATAPIPIRPNVDVAALLVLVHKCPKLPRPNRKFGLQLSLVGVIL